MMKDTIMPGNDYWVHVSLLFLLLFSLEYINGMIVKYKQVKVNYTRKINHFALFFTPQLLMNFFPYERTGITLLVGSVLTLLSLLIFINPIRQRVSILATMFLCFDRPEDRPYTLLWLITQFMGSYIVLGIVSFYLARYNALELLTIPILINGIGDGLAEPIGIRFGKHRYQTRALFTRKKYSRSIEGSACVFITSILVIYYNKYQFTDLQFVVAITAIPILMSLAEAFSPHTWDSPLLYGTGGMTLIGILSLH
jgi:phytol kinase